jgi:ketosteroid isomerase-like protein
MNLRKATLILGLVGTLAACQGGPEASLHDTERRAIAGRIDSLMRAFEEAERSRDPERVIEYLAPDFYMYVDGMRTGYNSVAANMRRTLGSLQHLEPGFQNVEVRVLGRNAALVSMTFRDSVVTASGQTQQLQGPTTLIWERLQGQWRLVYADADHYPVASQ